MPSIQNAYNWAIETCNTDNVGYSQSYRNQRVVNGITYYDCSSFIWYALINGGWDMVSVHGSWPFTTSNMRSVLLSLGFKKYSADVEWKPGDILWRSGHTEMAFDSIRSMGAHTSNADLKDQVSINTNDSRGNWKELYRYDNGATNEWIKGNRYLTIGEMQNNATIVFNYLLSKGWTVNAISAFLGNVQKESTINPGIWQNLTENINVGWGLVQWTPSTKYTVWATENGFTNDDGYGQLEWVINETISTGQWVQTSDYPISFSEFIMSTDNPEYLAYCFMANFEKPKSLDQPERKEYARYWFNWYNKTPVTPNNPPMDGREWTSKMPIWFYLRKRR